MVDRQTPEDVCYYSIRYISTFSIYSLCFSNEWMVRQDDRIYKMTDQDIIERFERQDAYIDKRFTDQDADFEAYIDMKIRAVKRQLSAFIWINKNRLWTVVIFLTAIFIGIWIAHLVDVRHTLENKTGIILRDETVTSERPAQ